VPTVQRSANVTRSDGKASKKAILEATLIIILEDGIRSVKYQTVADRAGVTTSATAYYFKDMQHLIKEAFLYYLDSYKEVMGTLRESAAMILSPFAGKDLQDIAIRKQLVEKFTLAFVDAYVYDHPDVITYFLLDRIFRNETLQNPALHGVLYGTDQQDFEAATLVFKQLGCKKPEVEAAHLMSTLSYISDIMLNMGYSETSKAHITDVIRSTFQNSLRVFD